MIEEHCMFAYAELGSASERDAPDLRCTSNMGLMKYGDKHVIDGSLTHMVDGMRSGHTRQDNSQPIVDAHKNEYPLSQVSMLAKVLERLPVSLQDRKSLSVPALQLCNEIAGAEVLRKWL